MPSGSLLRGSGYAAYQGAALLGSAILARGRNWERLGEGSRFGEICRVGREMIGVDNLGEG
jgi:hypothetical protein